MHPDTTLTISDDSGFLAIVDPTRYKSFVSLEWELPQLMRHFIDEMNNHHLIIWATGAENEWTVHFTSAASAAPAFRECTATIAVNDRKLFLTSYEDLTMAAQFEEEKVPAKHNETKYLELDNGNYSFTIRQLFNPEINDYTSGNIAFEIVIQPSTNNAPEKINNIFWQTT